MSFSDVEVKIVQWGEDRGIVQNGKPVGQARKTVEEAGELVDATAKVTLLREMSEAMPSLRGNEEFYIQMDRAMDEAKDAVGDVLVTLLMVCATLKVDFTDCVYQAYDEIKDRKGYLRFDGVFVKGD